MTYTHLTTDELVMIKSYHHKNIPVAKIAAYLNRTRTPIYNVINFLKEGHTALDYYQQYQTNKKRCGRHKIILSKKQQTYIKKKVTQGWTPDGIIGWAEEPVECFVRTLYRQFKEKIFDENTLSMKGKRKPNGHKERRGNQAFKLNIVEREKDYPQFKQDLDISKATPL
ncbi:MAG: transposase, family [Carnobacterium sp.]|nr:transposase, family [Carnobacterium sp.]